MRLVDGLLSYPGIYPNLYTASHVQQSVVECNSSALHVPQSTYVLCVFTFLRTVIKELNLKFKPKENSHGIKRVPIILQCCI
jgi:hypothetical protein